MRNIESSSGQGLILSKGSINFLLSPQANTTTYMEQTTNEILDQKVAINFVNNGLSYQPVRHILK
jgi:hypothetical protein